MDSVAKGRGHTMKDDFAVKIFFIFDADVAGIRPFRTAQATALYWGLAFAADVTAASLAEEIFCRLQREWAPQCADRDWIRSA